MKDQEFVEYVVKALVDNPDQVKVDRRVDEMGVLITLDVASADMGKIIGRDGATAKALRTLLRVVGMKNSARVNLKINEPEGRADNGGSRVESVPAPAPKVEEEEIGGQSYMPAYDTSDVDAVMNDLKSL
ncbi:MAG: KH domain-containing protein [Candidatus Nomurabacteria bacterium]|nr:KH domain-containing protein [Candidatus Nomurabacteria bacterium]